MMKWVMRCSRPKIASPCPAGVSNFDLAQLAELAAFATVKPAVVQRNSDPFSQDADVRGYCRLAGIQYQVRHASRQHSTQPQASRPTAHAGL